MSALIPAPAAALATLPESARTLAAASLTTNTRRAYSGALARLDSFLAGRPLEDGALTCAAARISRTSASACAAMIRAFPSLRALLRSQERTGKRAEPTGRNLQERVEPRSHSCRTTLRFGSCDRGTKFCAVP